MTMIFVLICFITACICWGVLSILFGVVAQICALGQPVQEGAVPAVVDVGPMQVALGVEVIVMIGGRGGERMEVVGGV